MTTTSLDSGRPKIPEKYKGERTYVLWQIPAGFSDKVLIGVVKIKIKDEPIVLKENQIALSFPEVNELFAKEVLETMVSDVTLPRTFTIHRTERELYELVAKYIKQ